MCVEKTLGYDGLVPFVFRACFLCFKPFAFEVKERLLYCVFNLNFCIARRYGGGGGGGGGGRRRRRRCGGRLLVEAVACAPKLTEACSSS